MPALDAAQRLAKACDDLSFHAPVRWTYNPLVYAWDGHRRYIERFGAPPKRGLLVGMNPGPWGMGQTGVPFGDPTVVREWMGFREIRVEQPARPCPDRPVHGLASPRGEVSGTRLYSALREGFGSLDDAYRHLYVANYCPLLFFDKEAKNLTPDKLAASDQGPLFVACDAHLAALVDAFKPAVVVGIGRFAEARARTVAAAGPAGTKVIGVPHPSPANPQANRGGPAAWKHTFLRALANAGIGPVPP